MALILYDVFGCTLPFNTTSIEPLVGVPLPTLAELMPQYTFAGSLTISTISFAPQPEYKPILNIFGSGIRFGRSL
ncbi:MAG: hypothetical protein BWY67_02532 [Bacteroidetes bacterium ADurb.Bin397]|nr:MAG: hypothetical protein BWY67_02532 [Bacteroidetes bacterium ADurb.Bin397]